ncbi:hypothetical protein MOTT16_03455 [Moraxella osloensis]|uniref:FimV C-terminal domain n=1 Tax=Faucicola osloensis TaxID=34062 RepID=A0AAD0AD04_FAUOS|nr:hypothetical protein [Moraxella osloensis]ATQ82959.1 hypothetical protein YHS_03460 [Moraxella osloensis]ATW85459.1 hypothetical protein MOTT16_03455 [Moraxella osloensis]
MIGIAAVVILVIVAGVFLMKKGKSQTTVDTQTQVKRPKTLAEQQRELELQRQSQQPSPYAAPNLPQSTLQAAQTLNLNAQANNLKTLVDEEQSINARSTAMTHTAEAVEPDGLDFDLPGFKQDSDKPAINSTLHVVRPTVTQVAQPANPVDGISSKADNELDFDFALDVPETKIAPLPTATEPTTETTAAQSQSNEFTFDDFDFDLPSKQPATAETVAAPALELPTEIFAPIDEPVTTASASNVNNNNNAISDSGFDFDFSLPETQSTPAATATAPMLTTPTAAPSADNNIADDFDFDFELNAEPAVTVTPTNDATTEAALSFDTSDIKSSSNLTSDAVTSVPVASDEATDIASFALDDELLRQAEAASLAKPATPSVAEPVVDLAEVNAPKPSDSLLISDDMFDLSFDDSTTQAATPANTQTTTTPIASPETTSIADKASLTTAPVVEDLSEILDVIKDIDTDTLNVDLAEQYVNLGEYDSAKRLLDEIKDSNNTALVERAAALRQRIA